MNYGKYQGLRRACMAVMGALTLATAPWAMAQQTAPAAAQAAAGQATAPPDDIDEVVVQGGRLYDRIVSAEDRFFKLYNELNKEDDFDTNCAFLPIDSESRMEQRFCMPSFFADATAERIRLDQYCKSLIEKDEDGNVLSEGACYSPPTAEQIFFSRREAYVSNVIKVIDSDPRLKKMATELDAMHRERDALSHKYDDIKKKKIATNGEKREYRPTIR
jgi:hypothetical protein